MLTRREPRSVALGPLDAGRTGPAQRKTVTAAGVTIQADRDLMLTAGGGHYQRIVRIGDIIVLRLNQKTGRRPPADPGLYRPGAIDLLRGVSSTPSIGG